MFAVWKASSDLFLGVEGAGGEPGFVPTPCKVVRQPSGDCETIYPNFTFGFRVESSSENWASEANFASRD